MAEWPGFPPTCHPSSYLDNLCIFQPSLLNPQTGLFSIHNVVKDFMRYQCINVFSCARHKNVNKSNINIHAKGVTSCSYVSSLRRGGQVFEESSCPQRRDIPREGLICEPSAASTSGSWGSQCPPGPEREPEQRTVVSTIAL